MHNQEENNGSKFVLKKKYREEMEAEGLTMEEFLEKKQREREEQEMKRLENYPESEMRKVIETLTLPNNAQNLGFEKNFFTLEDAEFLIQQVAGLDDEFWEPTPMPAEERANEIQTFLHTGVRYDLRNLGVTIYTTWQFLQTNLDNGSSGIEYLYLGYYYNHFTGEFREINDEEGFDIENFPSK